MQNPKLKEVKKAFYKDNECIKPNFELLSLDEIEKKLLLNIPNNHYEKKYWENLLRQIIYRIRDFEKEENGRILVQVKIEKGNPVKYGFTKKPKHLMANLKRLKRKAEKNVNKYNELKAHTKNLTDHQSEELELIFDDGTTIKIK